MKKLLSITLCVLIILSSISVATFTAASEMSLKQAIEIYEKNSGEKVNTKRYYFLMPNGTNSEVCDDEFYKNYGERPQSWYNENATTAGVWWWSTRKIDPQWPGFKMMKDTSESVYYADVPDFVETLIFNNYFDPGNVHWNDPTYFDSAQTINIDLSAIKAGESYMLAQCRQRLPCPPASVSFGQKSDNHNLHSISPSFYSCFYLWTVFFLSDDQKLSLR